MASQDASSSPVSAAAAAAPPLNALQANVAARGAAAYYYAHANSSGGLRSTGEAPRLIASSATSSAPAGARAARAVESFSWSDDGDSVRVYVPFEGAAVALGEADVSLVAAARSFALEIRPPGAGLSLVLKRDGLFGDVTGGRVRRLKERVLVLLSKAPPALTWYDLEEPARLGGDE